MLRIVNLEELERLLLQIPGLVNRAERRDPDLSEKVRAWFLSVEGALTNNCMAVVGDVAALRGTLFAAERGVIPAGLTVRGRPTTRKILTLAVLDILRRAEDTLANAIRDDSARIAEANRLGRQLVAFAKARGLIPAEPVTGDRTGYLKNLVRLLSSQEDMAAGVVRLEALVGPHDALVILDRMLAMDGAAVL